jgi:hypothetical protein
MTLLHEHVPITLICDLVSVAALDSAAINRAERPARDPIRLEVAEHSQDVAAHTEAHPSQAASA